MLYNSNIFPVHIHQHRLACLPRPETDTEVNVESLVNFVVTDQNGLGGASIGIGYVGFQYPSFTGLTP